MFREKVQRCSRDREPPPNSLEKPVLPEESVARETYVQEKSEPSILDEGKRDFLRGGTNGGEYCTLGAGQRGKRGEAEVDGIENVLDRKLAETCNRRNPRR